MSIEQENLPDYDKFKKLNTIIITPLERNSKAIPQEDTNHDEPIKKTKGFIMNNSKYEKEIKANLSTIYRHYISRFETICDEVLMSKYDTIYVQIYNYMQMMQFSNNDFLHGVIINTDQNSASFFEGLGNYIRTQLKKIESSTLDIDKLIIPKGEFHFKDLKKLFIDLNIENLNYEYMPKAEKLYPTQRLIVIGDPQRIDPISLNIFLKRMMEYQKETYREWDNIILFDVAYDPRSLFEKIKANLLAKMVFHQVDNVPSKNIYKEVLYKYIYEKSTCLFIPNSNNTKRIVDYINNHQISIDSFKHYFRFSILMFFLMHSWDDDRYLFFSAELEKIALEGDEKNLRQENLSFFLKKLTHIYGKQNLNNLFTLDDIDKLVDDYIQHFNNRCVFFKFYQMFEDIILELTTEYSDVYESFDKFQFFFEFLQYNNNDDDNNEKKNNNNKNKSSRSILLEKYFKKFPKADYIILISKFILPQYINVIQTANADNLDDQIHSDLLQLCEELKKIAKEDIEHEKAGGNIKRPRFDTTEQIFEQLKNWMENLFSVPIFDIINDFDKDEISKKKKRKWINPYKNYLHFNEAVNPALAYNIMNTLIGMTKRENDDNNSKQQLQHRNKSKEKINEESNDDDHKMIEDKFEFDYCLMKYIDCFKKLGSNFKLKLFLIEFLNEFNIGLDDNNKENNEIRNNMKTIFLYLSYAFCLIGFFSKKKGMGDDIYMKNYYSMTDYYNK